MASLADRRRVHSFTVFLLPTYQVCPHLFRLQTSRLHQGMYLPVHSLIASFGTTETCCCLEPPPSMAADRRGGRAFTVFPRPMYQVYLHLSRRQMPRLHQGMYLPVHSLIASSGTTETCCCLELPPSMAADRRGGRAFTVFPRPMYQVYLHLSRRQMPRLSE